MTRTVTALFDGRTDAEAARARLAAEVKVEATRMLGKETAAAVDDLKLEPNHAKVYREALLGGDHLLVAKIARGENPKRIIRLLSEPAPETAPAEAQQAYEIGPSAAPEDTREPQPAGAAVEEPSVSQAPASAAIAAAAAPAATAGGGEAVQSRPPEPEASAAPVAPAEAPEPREELRIGEAEVVRGGAADSSAASRASLKSAAAGRRLSPEEVEARGLLKERVIEVVEMREEPVVAKEVVVREEVIVRKTVKERTATIHDTLRRTQVEVEELPAKDSAP